MHRKSCACLWEVYIYIHIKMYQFLFWPSAPVIYSLVEQMLPCTGHTELFFCSRDSYRQRIFSNESAVLHLVCAAEHSTWLSKLLLRTCNLSGKLSSLEILLEVKRY